MGESSFIKKYLDSKDILHEPSGFRFWVFEREEQAWPLRARIAEAYFDRILSEHPDKEVSLNHAEDGPGAYVVNVKVKQSKT